MDTTKAKLSHDSTKGLSEPPKKQSQAAASSWFFLYFSKEEGKKAPKTLIVPIVTIALPFCYRVEYLSIVFNLVF